MTPEQLSNLVDSLRADATSLRNKGEVGYANGLTDAARRLERAWRETVAAPPTPPPVPEPEPEPQPEKKTLGVF